MLALFSNDTFYICQKIYIVNKKIFIDTYEYKKYVEIYDGENTKDAYKYIINLLIHSQMLPFESPKKMKEHILGTLSAFIDLSQGGA